MPPWPSKKFLGKTCDSHEGPCRWGRYIVGHGSHPAISELMSQQILSTRRRPSMSNAWWMSKDDRIIVRLYSIICHGFISVFLASSKAGSSFSSHKVIGSGRATFEKIIYDASKMPQRFLPWAAKASFRLNSKTSSVIPEANVSIMRLQPQPQLSTSAMCNSPFSRHFGSSFCLTYSKHTSLPVGASNRWGHAAQCGTEWHAFKTQMIQMSIF